MCVNRAICFVVISQPDYSATKVMQQKQHMKISSFKWHESMDM